MHSSLIARCGMNCGLCMAYLRENNKCPGCRGSNDGKARTRTGCKIKNCEIVDSKYCYSCHDFPCEKLKHLDARYRAKYNMSMIGNLETIKTIGIRNFLKIEKIKWTCPDCGGTICVHKGACSKCGRLSVD